MVWNLQCFILEQGLITNTELRLVQPIIRSAIMSDSVQIKESGSVVLAMLLDKYDQEREQKVLLG